MFTTYSPTAQLQVGVVAIGGETIGKIIGFGRTTWELDLREPPAFRPAAEKLNVNVSW